MWKNLWEAGLLGNTIANMRDIDIGVNAENAVLEELSKLDDVTLFRNFPLGCKDNDGKITSYLQCDIVAVCGLDVFVIEVKGWNGSMYIKGPYLGKEWSTEYDNRFGDRCAGTVPNIYVQNQDHIAVLKTIMNNKSVRYHNVIVFTNKDIHWDEKMPNGFIMTNVTNINEALSNSIRESVRDESVINTLSNYQNEHTEDMFFDFLAKAFSSARN